MKMIKKLLMTMILGILLRNVYIVLFYTKRSKLPGSLQDYENECVKNFMQYKNTDTVSIIKELLQNG